MLRSARLLVPLAGWLACAAPSLGPETLRPPPGSGWARVGPDERAPLDRPDGKVWVHYPHGACATAWLEIQVLEGVAGADPASRQWVAHPDGARIRSGTCRFEDPTRLLNETRVRCYDPAGERAPSTWVVGVEIDGSEPPEGCAEKAPE